MIQGGNGIHIGLAAWINLQRNSGGFVSFPATPISIELADLGSIQTASDLAKAAEFSMMVNFLPRKGAVATPFSETSNLWSVHRDILRRMDHATEPLTSTEREQYRRAREVLFIVDGLGLLVPSPKHLLYQELGRVYEDLYTTGASSDLLAMAMVNWLEKGFKLAVEDAFEVILRLSAKSSRNQVQNELLLLHDDPPGIGFRTYADLQFAPVYFAPLTAMFRETWMEATVSFTDLDAAVATQPANSQWTAFRANKTGQITFKYVVLACLRPWFSPSLYFADDWRLDAGTTNLVSNGHGAEGLMPAYVDAVYLVSVKDVTSEPKPPIVMPELELQLVHEWTRIPNVTLRAKVVPDLVPLPKPVDGLGVVKTKRVLGHRPERAKSKSGTMFARFDRGAVVELEDNMVLARLGEVQPLTKLEVDQRYTTVVSILEMVGTLPTFPEPERNPQEIYVAGFGCQTVPLSPNPNPSYHW